MPRKSTAAADREKPCAATSISLVAAGDRETPYINDPLDDFTLQLERIRALVEVIAQGTDGEHAAVVADVILDLLNVVNAKARALHSGR